MVNTLLANTAVIIPSIGCSSLLIDVVHAGLASHADQVWIIENQSFQWERHQPSALARLMGVTDWKKRHPFRSWQYQNAAGQSLYQVWNMGMDIANVVCILNDDVEISPEAIDALLEHVQHGGYAALGADYTQPSAPYYHPRPTRGTYRHGGIGGFAFAVDCTLGIRVDEQFEWWGGDDDLMFQLEAHGHRTGILQGAGVAHLHPETSAVRFPELGEAKARDRVRLLDKWGDSW